MAKTISDCSITISNSVSKVDAEEEMSSFLDRLGELAGGRSYRRPISNEQICMGEELLGIYKVASDAIEGGMGSVWKVHHMDWDADMAMKRPQPYFFAEAGERKKLFIKECEHWIRLGQHPNIVTCYYVREVGGVPTVFSEWMEGGSLKDRIRDGSLYEGEDWEVNERILSIAVQSAKGLEYAQKLNLVHQDVKPGNILLTKGWDAKVGDFGLAGARSRTQRSGKQAAGSAVEAGNAAAVGSAVEADRKGAAGNAVAAAKKEAAAGYTLEYCPKEQAEGAPPMPWMDCYAWALTVLEMYAGKRLWETGAEAKEHYRQYLSKCRVSVPKELQGIIRSCLEGKERFFRFFVESVESLYYETLRHADKRPVFNRDVMDTIGNMNNHALSFLDIGRPDLAESEWEKALHNSPNDREIIYNRGLYRLRSGQVDEAGLIAELEELQRNTGENVEDYIREIRQGRAHYIVHRPSTFSEVVELNRKRMRLIHRARHQMFQVFIKEADEEETGVKVPDAKAADVKAGLAYLEQAREFKGLAIDPEMLDINTQLGMRAKRDGIREMYPRLGMRFKKINWGSLCFARGRESFYHSQHVGQGEDARGYIKMFFFPKRFVERVSDKKLFGDCLLSEKGILAAAYKGSVQILDFMNLDLKSRFRVEDCGLGSEKAGNEVIGLGTEKAGNDVIGLRFDREAGLLVACRRNGIVSVFDVRDPEKGSFVRNIYSGAEGAPAFDLSPDGKLLLTAGADSNELRVWDVSTGERICRCEVGGGGIERAFFTYDPEKVLVSVRNHDSEGLSADGPGLHALYLKDWKTGAEAPEYAGENLITLTPIGERRWFAAVDPEPHEIVFFSAEEPERRYKANGLLPDSFRDGVERLVFSPNGRYLLIPGADTESRSSEEGERLRLWEIDWIFNA